jgi:hypothetical protein
MSAAPHAGPESEIQTKLSLDIASLIPATGFAHLATGGPAPQCVRLMVNSTASSSACFIGAAGNSASASLAMEP